MSVEFERKLHRVVIYLDSVSSEYDRILIPSWNVNRYLRIEPNAIPKELRKSGTHLIAWATTGAPSTAAMRVERFESAPPPEPDIFADADVDISR
jgi:hypothetical protein